MGLSIGFPLGEEAQICLWHHRGFGVLSSALVQGSSRSWGSLELQGCGADCRRQIGATDLNFTEFVLYSLWQHDKTGVSWASHMSATHESGLVVRWSKVLLWELEKSNFLYFKCHKVRRSNCSKKMIYKVAENAGRSFPHCHCQHWICM